MPTSHFESYELPKGVEPFRSLTNAQLDEAYTCCQKGLEEATEALKMAQEERFRRYRIVHMMAEHGDWPGGGLDGLRLDPRYEQTY